MSCQSNLFAQQLVAFAQQSRDREMQIRQLSNDLQASKEQLAKEEKRSWTRGLEMGELLAKSEKAKQNADREMAKLQQQVHELQNALQVMIFFLQNWCFSQRQLTYHPTHPRQKLIIINLF